MFTDLILFVAAATTILKLALKHIISAQLAGEMLVGVAVGIAVIRIFGSTAFRKRIRTSKVLASLAMFALDVAGGEPVPSAIVAMIAAGVGVMMFGVYFMFSAFFPDSVSRQGSRALALGTIVAFLIGGFVIANLFSRGGSLPAR